VLRGVAGERYEGALEQRTREGGGAAFVREGHGEASLRDGGRCLGQWRNGAPHAHLLLTTYYLLLTTYYLLLRDGALHGDA
jgi:hypothetical protein